VPQPFFTIGIATYNRHGLLKEALLSILAQDFSNYEVIVGNDYQAEFLTEETIGVSDSRIRFVNHPQNLREVGNMNALLQMASGRYFTWLFDDDLYEPGFLHAAYDVLERTGFPPALFPSYKIIRGTNLNQSEPVTCGRVQVFDGREYLRQYFTGCAKLISTCGLFETKTLKQVVGGVEELSTSVIGLYCEYDFLVRCALLERVVYMDAPFVIFRAHSDSWGDTNIELKIYLEAGEQLVRRSSRILQYPPLRSDYLRNLLGVCKIHLFTFCYTCVRFEKNAGGLGLLLAFRACLRVLKEILRIRKVFAEETNDTWIGIQLKMLPVIAKCLYLICFALLHYSRRNERDHGNEPRE
jgi:glycosyltransferase involved in cell wall biosynthesis